MIKQKIIKIYDFFVNGVIASFGRLFVCRNKYVNVIYYHDIVEGPGFSKMRTNIDVFKSQMQYLYDHGYRTLTFDELSSLENLKFSKKTVLIAFDDGWRSNYDAIFSFMKEKGIKYNIFLTAGEIGKNPEYLDWPQVREMHESGMVGFGAHTYTHPSMKDIKAIDWHREIEQANETISCEIGITPLDFCYPFGYYSEQSNVEIETKSSYQRIYTSEQMYSYKQNGKIIFGRNGIDNDDSLTVFFNKLAGYANYMCVHNKFFYNPLLAVYHIFHKPTIEQ